MRKTVWPTKPHKVRLKYSFALDLDLLHCTIPWIPSHIGITGNERADQLANMGCKRQHIDIHVGLELQELYGRVAIYQPAVATGMEQRDNWTTHFYNIPDVASRDRILFETRSAEVLAHRLRLGKCRLNYYLHKIALHDTGTCDSCGQAETIEHYLINCPQNEIAALSKISATNGRSASHYQRFYVRQRFWKRSVA